MNKRTECIDFFYGMARVATIFFKGIFRRSNGSFYSKTKSQHFRPYYFHKYKILFYKKNIHPFESGYLNTIKRTLYKLLSSGHRGDSVVSSRFLWSDAICVFTRLPMTTCK